MRHHLKKATPKKYNTLQSQETENYASINNSSHKKSVNTDYYKDQSCPLSILDLHSWNNIVVATPIKKQPQLMMSPSPIKKDLFHQLLGTQTKNSSPFGAPNQMAIMEEDDLQYFSQSIEDQSHVDNSNNQDQDSQLDNQNQGNWSQQNGIKKRKRKSTNQIKMLKQQLDGEMNWSKQKIVKMAEITGLSQSQVYKWCWDQKKKQVKNKDDVQKNHLQKRKLIKKQTFNKSSFYQGQYKKLKDEEQNEQIDAHNCTKVKNMNMAVDDQEMSQFGNANTEKKVNKRLVFH